MSSERFRVGDTVYMVNDGIILSEFPFKVIQKKDGCIQVENTHNGFKSWWTRDHLTKKLTIKRGKNEKEEKSNC